MAGLRRSSPKLSGVYEPGVPGSVVQIRNIPFANDNFELDATAAWRLSNHMKLDASFTHNNIRHTDREVPDADDNRLRLQWAWTGNSWGTLRASYEYASLSGSDYTSNPYTPYYSTALPGYVPLTPAGDAPFTLAKFAQIRCRRPHRARSACPEQFHHLTEKRFAAGPGSQSRHL